ncbi:amino acid adenylation domain-containing protein/non-ribosomal peptide synthase protein (TIGR01720 family) [Fontibacillus solani]|uniref:Amino acid adenylation domain-containing protein/non-ribosomal peptide synthase protein (TIGR01720 family) n=1 Tax=Fontibacillus solani TaxID=1572857 RepID=A0A7W3SXJ4_9BACL|nr:non-ribosomal peptide synthetase [Fontibacillus solani]MBA9087958.1 amino acid adenylation domain-containing protein/non-ribosomal peptide synthase protein (TIGR01720 family) [Fontibacillus solani]
MKNFLERDIAGESRQYWMDLLSLPWEQVELPSPYPKQSQFTLKETSFAIEEETALRLLQMGKSSSMSVFVLLLASFQCMLHKYNDQEDIVLSLPILPSNDAQTNDCIINRISIHKGMTFQNLLMQSRDMLTHGYMHQHYPLTHVASLLGKNGENPWPVPILFAMEQLHGEQESLRALLLKYQPNLTVTIARDDPQIQLNVAYNAEQYSAGLIEAYFTAYSYLLRQIVQNSKLNIDELQLLSTEERNRLLYTFNDTDRQYDESQMLHRLFEESAKRVPDRVAVIHDKGSSTYAELDSRSNRLGRLLQNRGVVPGDHVAVVVDRSEEMITAVLAVLKAGGAYVPMEPSLPRSRIEHIVKSLNIRHIITKQVFIPHLSEMIWKLPCLQEIYVVDAMEERLSSEEIDVHAVSELWNHFSSTGVDRVTRGGFYSSYNGEPFSEEEVEEYVQRVVGLTIPHLHSASRVLEIGCGSGLIAFELAEIAGEVVGMDPSESTLALNREQAERLGLNNTTFLNGFAHELTEKVEGEFDLILLASTAHFFPGYVYTQEVIRQCLNMLRQGGVLILADLPDLMQKERFRESLEEHRRDHGIYERQRTNIDTELYFNESFLRYVMDCNEHLVSFELVRRNPQKIVNELRFRMDVILYKQSIVTETELNRNPSSLKEEPDKRFWSAHHIGLMDEEPVRSTVTSDDRAYVIFTSGSTGVPKGVVVQHRPVINLIDWVNRTYRITEQDRVLFITSLSFDLSVYDIFGLLAAGGSIRVVGETDVRRGDRLLKMLEEEHITLWDSAPAALQLLTPLLEEEHVSLTHSRLRLIFLSGDWIPLNLPNVLQRSFPGVEVIGLGGATEATIWSNYFPIEEVKLEWVSIPYGRPIQNARYYVLDSRLSPCPVHVPGELYIGGDCLASGYTNASLTEERFIPDHFVHTEGAKMYRTGDRARWMPDGNIEFLGRLDHQVKIRGYRVEIAEIQAKMLKHPAIREAIVTDYLGQDGQKQLCAYYVTSQAAFRADDLRDYLAGFLPSYMVPSYFVSLECMPLTENGKVNRRLLPEPVQDGRGQKSYIAPRDEKEETIAAIWSELIGVEQIGIRDNFFHMGGNSMHIIGMHMKLSEHGYKVSTSDLFKYQTIETLAEVIAFADEDREPAKISAGQLPIHPNVIYSLSFENDPYKHRFGVKKWIQLPVRLAPETVRDSLRILMNRHDALLLRYRQTENGWVQTIVSPEDEIPFEWSDVSGLDVDDREKLMSGLIENLEENVSLKRGSLFYFHLFDCGEWSEIAYFVHHFTNDLHSMSVFEQEFAMLIQQQTEGSPIKLPAATSTFKEFCEAMLRYVQSEACLKQIDYWKSPVARDYEIPRDRDGQCVGWSYEEVVHSCYFSEGVQLLGHIGRAGLQMNDILTTAFLRMYYRWSGKPTLVLNVFEDGRCLYEKHLDLSRTMGWMATMIPVKFEIDPNASILEQLLQVKEQYTNHPHDNSYWLLRYYHPDPIIRQQIASMPEPQINFNFRGMNSVDISQDNSIVSKKVPYPDVSAFYSDLVRNNFLLFNCAIESNRLTFDWNYSTEVHTAATIDRLTEMFLTELQHIVHAIEERVQ